MTIPKGKITSKAEGGKMTKPKVRKETMTKSEKKNEGKIAILPGELKIYIADGETIPSYARVTKEKAWLDNKNKVHLGEYAKK